MLCAYWIACRPGFFLSVRVLSRLFRRVFLVRLRNAFDGGELHFSRGLAALQDATAFARYLAPIARAEWVVYAKPPFGGPERVLEYLGRYTHRVAIANSRLVEFADDAVAFRWKVLLDLAEIARASGAELTQESADRRQMVRDSLRFQTALASQIVSKLGEDPLLRCSCRDRRRRNCAGAAQSQQPPLQRGPVIELDGLLRSLVPQIALHHAFIKVAQPGPVACHPSQEITDHVEAAPSAVPGEPEFDETRCIQLDKLPVGTASKASEQPTPAQNSLPWSSSWSPSLS